MNFAKFKNVMIFSFLHPSFPIFLLSFPPPTSLGSLPNSFHPSNNCWHQCNFKIWIFLWFYSPSRSAVFTSNTSYSNIWKKKSLTVYFSLSARNVETYFFQNLINLYMGYPTDMFLVILLIVKYQSKCLPDWIFCVPSLWLLPKTARKS